MAPLCYPSNTFGIDAQRAARNTLSFQEVIMGQSDNNTILFSATLEVHGEELYLTQSHDSGVAEMPIGRPKYNRLVLLSATPSHTPNPR